MDGVINNPGFYVSYAVIQAIVVLLAIRLLDFYDRQPLGALNVLGEVAMAGGNGDATRLFKEALQLRRELGDERLVANSLLLLGRVDGGEERFEEALELARGLDDSWMTSVALLRLGEARQDRGLIREALEIARDRGDARLAEECEHALAELGAAAEAA